MPTQNENLSLMLLKARENSIACIKPALTRYNLTEQQWRVIRVLYQIDDTSAQDLANQSCILSPSLSRILSRLTQDGIVLRKTDSEDQRAQSIRLSAKGKRLHDKILPLVEKQYKTLLGDVGKEKVSRLINLLETYTEAAQGVAST